MRLRVATRLLDIQRVLVRHDLDEFILATHLFRPLRFTFYLSPATGELVSRRHELWRVFDIVWMLHIMDYDERENVNNWLLRGFTWLAVLTALSGAWLLWFAFPRRRKKVRGQ